MIKLDCAAFWNGFRRLCYLKIHTPDQKKPRNEGSIIFASIAFRRSLTQVPLIPKTDSQLISKFNKVEPHTSSCHLMNLHDSNDFTNHALEHAFRVKFCANCREPLEMVCIQVLDRLLQDITGVLRPVRSAWEFVH